MERIGAVGRNRTRDPPLTKRLLYQLSYNGYGVAGRIRTCGQQLRRLLLYPLSYSDKKFLPSNLLKRAAPVFLIVLVIKSRINF